MPKVIDHWSYSAWAVWNKCAYAFYSGYILGRRSPPHPAMARGIEIHRLAEFYLQGKISVLPPAFKDYKNAYRNLKRAKPIVEQFWGVNDRFRAHKGRGSWCVMKMDAAVEPNKLDGWLYIQDLKTGREYPDHPQQGELYSCIGMALYPEAKGTITEFWYVDQGYRPLQLKYTRKLLKKKTNKWLEAGAALLDPDQKYLPSPSKDNCNWCIHATDKGGTCKAWKKAYPNGR